MRGLAGDKLDPWGGQLCQVKSIPCHCCRRWRWRVGTGRRSGVRRQKSV